MEMEKAASFPKRDQGIDTLRTVAILLMIASHTTRMIPKDMRLFWSDFVLWIEPFTAGSFLFLVGASLWTSRRNFLLKTKGSLLLWYRGKVYMALILFFIGTVMYTVDLGVVWPDVLILSGILANIAFSLLFWGALCLFKQPVRVVTAGTLLLLLLFLIFDWSGSYPYFLAWGNSPFLPLAVLPGLGFLFILFWSGAAERHKIVLGVFCLLVFVGFNAVYKPGKLFTKPVGRYSMPMHLDIIWPAKNSLSFPPNSIRKTRNYYNLRAVILPPIVTLMILVYFLGSRAFRDTDWDSKTGFLLHKILSLGRHSLSVYVVHLVLIGVFIRDKKTLVKSWQGTAALVAIIMACYFMVWGWERYKYRVKLRKS